MDILYRQSLLFDCYGELLTKKQREVFRLHLQEDWSLGEIGTELGISRQGVHDALKKGQEALERYEAKLHIVERYLSLSDDFLELKASLKGTNLKKAITFEKKLRGLLGASEGTPAEKHEA